MGARLAWDGFDVRRGVLCVNKIVVLNDQDNVATSLLDLDAGTDVDVPIGGATVSVSVKDRIEFGHKLAIRDVAAGSDILKYGAVIGRASRAIEAGEWVHIHNIESVRARGDQASGAEVTSG